jgi:hypothetical protein
MRWIVIRRIQRLRRRPSGPYDVEGRPDTPNKDGSIVFETPDLTLEDWSMYIPLALGYATLCSDG